MKRYITTAIPYVNGAPHIGHAVDYCLADTCARYLRLRGDEVRFQAGTDEHGSKNAQKAEALGMPVERYVAENARKFRDFIAKLGVEYTDYVRTTDADHVRRAQEIWRRLAEGGHIYMGSYEGWYCTGCESFMTEKEYAENGGVCPDHGKPYERLKEENYYLKISEYKERIREAIESGEMRILPEFRRKEVLRLLADSPDVSISRPKEQLSWGVPVPGDEGQVMYVWMDALANYITVLGYPEVEVDAWWPAYAQFVGKDILRFHAIIWPAMLLGLGLPLPQTLVAHGHVLANGQKMSKSLGNVVDPLEVLGRHGVEAFRYYFLRHVDSFADADFTGESFERAYNDELANDLGNLVQRLATLAAKNGVTGVEEPVHGGGEAEVEELAGDRGGTGAEGGQANRGGTEVGGTEKFRHVPKKNTLAKEYCVLMDGFEFSKAMDYVWGRVQGLNRRIDEEKPWALAKNGETEKLGTCLKSLMAEMVEIGVMIGPFLPGTGRRIEEIFVGRVVPPEVPLFPKG